MRRGWALLLPVMTLVAVASALSTAMESKQVEAIFTGKRSPRVQAKATDTEGTEERGIIDAAALKLAFRPWSTKIYPINVLDKLVASKVSLTDDTMCAWLKYVLKYRVVKGEHNDFASNSFIFSTFTGKFPEERIALLLVSMAKQSELKGLSKQLEPQLFSLLRERQVSTDYLNGVLRVETDGSTVVDLASDPAYRLWVRYVTEVLKPN